MVATSALGAALAPQAPPQPSSSWLGPADRAAAEAAVREIYAVARLSPPQIVWAASPVALARHWKVRRHTAGDSVRGVLLDTVINRAMSAARRSDVGGGLDALRSSLPDLTAMLAHEGQRAGVGALARLHLAGNVLRALMRRRPWHSFRAVSLSPYDLRWLLDPKLPERVAASERAAVSAAATLVGNAGWIVPHVHTCWLSDKPLVLSLDDRGRLHAKNGPAIRYKDGWHRYAWKGIEVPGAFVDHPERITLNAIDSQTDIFVRRCLIEMVTPKRFIYMGGADLVMRDETGTLWRRTWPRGDAWAAVEVVNGTPGPDGQLERYVLQVPPELETARAAVAWTYGMTDQQYRSLVVRT